MITVETKKVISSLIKKGKFESSSRIIRRLILGSEYIRLSISDIDWDIEGEYEKTGFRPAYFEGKNFDPVFRLRTN
jgi:Arc/MetJ-type ribon-helix-helix transcriptional regulator